MASSSADSAKKMGKAGDSRGTKRAHADSCNPAASRKGASAAGGKSMKGALMEKADNVPQGVRRSGRERSSVERYKPPPPQRKLPRFSITPVNEWDWLVKRMGCSVQNTLTWRNKSELDQPLPKPASPCWLLPCKDDTAVEIAKYADQLRALGWKLLTCKPHVVSRIGNKANLHAYAKQLGLLEHLPQHWSKPEAAQYPCMLKASSGEHGRDVFIVHSTEEVAEKAAGGFNSGKWLLQELCAGRIECATSLLVKDGEILDAICTCYEYDAEVYVWPFVTEFEDRRHSHSQIPPEHLKTMGKFLKEFSGICNFNYKVRPNGGLCIFECNARVGADLACDVPRRRANQFITKMDGLYPSLPQASPVTAEP